MNSPTHLDMGRAETADRSMSQTTIEGVARDIGRSVAQSVIHRIQNFPEREALLFRRKIRESSLPEQILWDGLGEEAAPVFMAYKLIHEALSNAPQFFRAALVAFMRAQPERFSACFSRETIWSVMAAFPSFDPPEAPLISDLREMLSKANNTGIWWRTDWEIMREAQALQKCLDNGKFGRGFLALKALQSEKARGIACGAIRSGDCAVRNGARKRPRSGSPGCKALPVKRDLRPALRFPQREGLVAGRPPEPRQRQP